LITALNGLVVVFVVSSEFLRRRRQRQRLARADLDDSPPPDHASQPVEASS
jgi:hypothetical protein